MSLFQIQGASRKQIFERGMALALLPTVPFMVMAIVENLGRFLSPGPSFSMPKVLSGEGPAGATVWLLYGLVSIVSEVVAIRNFRKTIHGLNPMSVAAVVMILVALWCLITAAGFALLGYAGLMYPGQRIMS